MSEERQTRTSTEQRNALQTSPYPQHPLRTSMPAPVTHPLASQQDPSSPITQSPPTLATAEPPLRRTITSPSNNARLASLPPNPEATGTSCQTPEGPTRPPRTAHTASAASPQPTGTTAGTCCRTPEPVDASPTTNPRQPHHQRNQKPKNGNPTATKARGMHCRRPCPQHPLRKSLPAPVAHPPGEPPKPDRPKHTESPPLPPQQGCL